MKEEEREYIIDQDQGDFALFDILDWDEFNSLLKSNRMTRIERHTIRHMYVPQRVIREFLPVVAMLAVGSCIMDVIQKAKL